MSFWKQAWEMSPGMIFVRHTRFWKIGKHFWGFSVYGNLNKNPIFAISHAGTITLIMTRRHHLTWKSPFARI